GVAYQVQVEVPEAQMTSVGDLKNVPMATRDGRPLLLQNIAAVSEGTVVGEYDRYNMQRTITLSANVFAEDLGRLDRELTRAVAAPGGGRRPPPSRRGPGGRGGARPPPPAGCWPPPFPPSCGRSSSSSSSPPQTPSLGGCRPGSSPPPPP